MDNNYPQRIEASAISLYVCPYLGVEGIKQALACEELYWNMIDNPNMEDLKAYVSEETAEILCYENGIEYTEEQVATAEQRLSDALVKRYNWVICRGEICPKAVILDVTHEYSKPQHYLFCGFSPLPDRLPKE